MLPASNSIALLEQIESENLYLSLVQQLNKDFQLCNLRIKYELRLSPSELHKKLVQDVSNLIMNRFDDYLNLLYRIDISERELFELKHRKLDQTSDQIAFLILKRVYQKVWLKRNFDKL